MQFQNNYIAALLMLLILSACGSNSGEMMSEHDHGEAEMTTTDEVELTHTQIENIGLTYGMIASRNIRSTVMLNGRIELPPSGKAVVGSPLEGKITRVHVAAGAYVSKGQPLFTLQNLEILDWQQTLMEKRAEQSFLEADVERQKNLADQELAPVKNYQSALAKKMQVDAAIKALSAKLQAIGITDESEEADFKSTFVVTAPSSGTIQHLMASNGAFVSNATPLADIINNRNLHIHLLAFGEEIKHLKKGQVLNFFVQSRPEQIMQAEIFWINQMVEEGNNSYDVHAEIKSELTGLSAGEFVEARVINQEVTVPSLPLEAVSMDKGLNYIFVKEEVHDDAIHFRKVQIDVGESDLGFVEILPFDPLPLDQEVVIEGAFFVMAESKKGEEGAGHDHGL